MEREISFTARRIVKKTQSGAKDDKIGVPVEVQDVGQELGNTDLLILIALSKNVFSSIELTTAIGYSQRTRNYRTSLNKLLVLGYIEMTIPRSPRSKNQKYRITIKGREYLKTRNKE